MVVIRIEVGGQ